MRSDLVRLIYSEENGITSLSPYVYSVYLYLLQCTQNMVNYLPDSQLTPVYSAGHVHVYWLEL